MLSLARRLEATPICSLSRGIDDYHTKAARASLMHSRRADRPGTRKLPNPSPKHPSKKMWSGGVHDTQTGVPLGMPRGARCVQRFDDSLNSAIHITYRISLRSSSMREPRDPLLKVVFVRVNARYILILHWGMLSVACEPPISLRLTHLVHNGVE